MVGALVPARADRTVVTSDQGMIALREIIRYLCANKGNPPYHLVGKMRCVVEADEFHDHCLFYNPEVTIITNVVYDHRDWFLTWDSYVGCFVRFAHLTSRAIVCDHDTQSLLRPSIPSAQIFFPVDGTIPFTVHRGQHNQDNGRKVIRAIQAIDHTIDTSFLIQILSQTP
jgi:UDP-N-acetylmuramate-alanine ligase